MPLTLYKRFRKHLFSTILILVLVCPWIPAPLPKWVMEETRIQPLLRTLAEEAPAQPVRVIIQKRGEGDLETRVAQLGGTVTRDLPIINALGATLPARAVLHLAQDKGVRWISFDAPTVQSQTGGEIVYTTWASTASNSTNVSITDFNSEPIPAGRTIWFSAVLRAQNFDRRSATVVMDSATLSIQSDNETYELAVPAGRILFRPDIVHATTQFDTTTNTWQTVVPSGHRGVTFITGLAFSVPHDLPGNIQSVTWRARISSDRADADLDWKWAAAVYTQFSQDYNALGVKPVRKSDVPSDYLSNHEAGTPENFTHAVVAGATGTGGADTTGYYSASQSVNLNFQDVAQMTKETGPDDRFTWGSKGLDMVTGFEGEFTPGYAIDKVEVILRIYLPEALRKHIKLQVRLGDWHKDLNLKPAAFNTFVGAENTGDLVIDISDTRAWTWYDLNDLALALIQDTLRFHQGIYYDAIGIRVTSIPGQASGVVSLPAPQPGAPVDTSKLVNVFNEVVGATTVWNEAPTYRQGQGITVAVVDSGMVRSVDFGNRKFKNVNFNREYHDGKDRYGHGTFVAGVLAGSGQHAKGRYMGVAPAANLLNVRVSNDIGMSTEADVVEALQWIMLNQDVYNIRIVNLSLNSSVAQSYHTSPLSAAAEMLWFRGIVVVVSAGNNGSADLYPPANDPWVITVGATDDRGTVDPHDDVIAHFSAYGVDEAGGTKPDLVAPGTNIVAYLPNNGALTMGKEHKNHRLNNDYFRMSGTSIAAPMVSGAVALLLQGEPQLSPNQVKHRLMHTANRIWTHYEARRAGAGYLDIDAAVHGTTSESANQGVLPSELLRPVIAEALGDVPNWGAVNWNSVNWNSVNWNSVNWNSVNWNSVNWNSDYWDNSIEITRAAIERENTAIERDDNVDSPMLFLPAVTSHSSQEALVEHHGEESSNLFLPFITRN